MAFPVALQDDRLWTVSGSLQIIVASIQDTNEACHMNRPIVLNLKPNMTHFKVYPACKTSDAAAAYTVTPHKV